jgi:hypothetical protein
MGKNKKLFFLWLTVGVLCRLIPHFPNFSPALNIALLSGVTFSRRGAIAITVLFLFLSDLALFFLAGYPILNSWSWFTYSGFILLPLLGEKFAAWGFAKKIALVFSASLGFWLWTNFGVWVTGGSYPFTFSGLIACYLAAIPFLKSSLAGDLAWFGLIWGAMFLPTLKKSPRSQTN